MSPLSVLIASGYYWPESVGVPPYVTGIAEHLSAQGHRVRVVSGFPHLPAWRPLAQRRLAAVESRGGVDIRRRWHYIPRSQSALRRALYEGSLVLLGLTALPVRWRPDVVIGVIPTFSGGVLAAAAGAIYRRPYGLLVYDLMGSAADQSGVRGGSQVASHLRAVELGLARRAAGVAVIADGFSRYFVSGGVPPARVSRLRMWTLFTAPSESVAETRARLGWAESAFVCLHAGNMGQKQALDVVLGAAAVLRDTGVQIVLAGDGNDRERLRRRAVDLALENLSFVEPQPVGRFEAMLRAADVLIVNQRASVVDMSLPSKLTSYFAAGRPVVAAVAAGSETAREVQAAQAGLVVAPEDPNALAEGILALKDSERERSRHGERASAYAAERLSPDAALPEYERFVQGLVAQTPTAEG